MSVPIGFLFIHSHISIHYRWQTIRMVRKKMSDKKRSSAAESNQIKTTIFTTSHCHRRKPMESAFCFYFTIELLPAKAENDDNVYLPFFALIWNRRNKSRLDICLCSNQNYHWRRKIRSSEEQNWLSPVHRVPIVRKTDLLLLARLVKNRKNCFSIIKKERESNARTLRE